MVKYKLKDFAKWAKKAKLADWQLCNVIDEMERGLLGDRLGSNVYKKRVAVGGRGKSAGARTILCFKKDQIAVFLYGFAKNEMDNLDLNDLEALRTFSKDLIELTSTELELKTKQGHLIKVEETN